MEFSAILKILWSRRLATAAIVVLAVVAAVAVRMVVKSVPTGAATVQILVDSPDSALANLSQETTPLTTRASVFAQVMTSAAVLEDIAAVAGVPAGEITAEGPYSGPGLPLNTVTPSEARANQLLAEKTKYKLTFVAQTDEPVVTASVQGPNPISAAQVAGAIAPGVRRYVTTLQQQSATPTKHRVTIRQLGPPQTGSVNSSSRSTLMAAAFLGVLVLGLLALLGIEGLRRRSRELSALERDFVLDFDQAALDPHAPAALRSGSAAELGAPGPPAERRGR
jgi:capsular polysaccharide biosynthesis protein